MSMAVGCALRSFPVCSVYGSDQAESGSGRAEGVGRREGKIKADGTPWVPIRGASLCLHTVWDGTVIRAPWCRLLPQFQQTPRFPAALSPETGAFGRVAADERRRRQPLPPEARPHPLRCVEGRTGEELPHQGQEDRPPAWRGLRSNLAKRQRRRWRQARAERCGHFRPGRQARARRGLRPIPQSVERLESSPSWQPPRHRQVAFRPCGWQERQGRRPSALHPARRHLARWRARPALFGDRRPRRWRCFPRSRQGRSPPVPLHRLA